VSDLCVLAEPRGGLSLSVLNTDTTVLGDLSSRSFHSRPHGPWPIRACHVYGSIPLSSNSAEQIFHDRKRTQPGLRSMSEVS
jgi:hypothetical protein